MSLMADIHFNIHFEYTRCNVGQIDTLEDCLTDLVVAQCRGDTRGLLSYYFFNIDLEDCHRIYILLRYRRLSLTILLY